ncbi:E3 ubiquitin-protein ligase ZNF598-like [Antedon mediterranea]|uniref:E3 ubiquitin-protein ligase ZNF598-like n=1 Tax=Antedon mediterranea TaxID=105859 RepID=UPI003AF42D85
MSKTTDSISSTCVLCCQDAKLFAVGPCDHPICTKCSTRMRVLCEQKYCSVCRNDMETVIFMKKVHPYASIISHKFLYNKKAGIRFSASWMKDQFEDYISHKCLICQKDNKFKTIKLLEEHMRRNHELHFCNLCLEHVKVFTSERPLYNRKDLATHKRKGDADNTSYRGHPLCEFCDVRFYDNDELLKHLRRQHYFCHFCENDGISNQYYDIYENLRHHFRDQHYLCEEDGCINEEFTAAFRSEIDLKAHKASRHTGKRKEARQARQLDWHFNYTNPRANRDSVVTGADYHETHGSYRGRGRGSRYHSNREQKDTEKAIEESMQPDTAKEQRPPKRRDKPRVEKTERVPQVAAKPEEKKKRLIKEDEFEKRRAAAAAGKTYQKDGINPANEPSDWSTGNELTSCQFTESTWTNKVDEYPKVSKPLPKSEKVEKPLLKEVTETPKNIEPKPVKKNVDPPLAESDFPSLGGRKVLSSTSSGWNRTVPDAREFPSLRSAAKTIKSSQIGNTSVSAKTSKEPELKVDFSRAIATNAMLHDKKKKAPYKAPWQPPPSTRSYKDFPTLSSIANILNPEPKQAWAKTCQPQVVAKNVVKTKPSNTINSQMTTLGKTGQQKPSKQKEKSAETKNQQILNSKSENGGKSNSQQQIEQKNGSHEKVQVQEKPPKGVNPLTLNSKPENGSKSNSLKQTGQRNGSHEKIQQTPPKEKNQQTINSSYENGNKSNFQQTSNQEKLQEKPAAKTKLSKLKFSNSLPSKDQPKPEKIERSKEISSSVERRSKAIDTSKEPDGNTKRLPPGFQQAPNSTFERHPPGFSLPASNPPPGFTTVPEITQGLTPAAVFIEPNNFKKRNKDLVDQIQSHLNYDPEGFNEFKQLSGKFRQGFLSADIYYKSCNSLLGQDNFQSVFPDLVALLPDTIKQQELLLVNNDHKILAKERGEKVLAIKKKRVGPSAWNSNNQTTKCNDCGQVLLQKDLIAHTNSCSANTDFPSLSSASAPRHSSTAWGRVK